MSAAVERAITAIARLGDASAEDAPGGYTGSVRRILERLEREALRDAAALEVLANLDLDREREQGKNECWG